MRVSDPLKTGWTHCIAAGIAAAMPTTAPPEYQVVLDAFRGPLDLLLFLVKREEVDVRDIQVGAWPSSSRSTSTSSR